MAPAQFVALVEQHRRKEKDDWRKVATIMAAIYEVNRNPKKRPRPFTADDFLPREKKKQTDRQMFEAVKALHAAFGR